MKGYRSDNHIMLDCETVGTGTTPVLLTIGIVNFSLSDLEIRDRALYAIDLDWYQGEIGNKFSTSLSSVMWWMKQAPEIVHANFFGGSKAETTSRVPLYYALEQLTRRLHLYEGPPQIWSNDELADQLWLENTYKVLGLPEPWPYYAHRCYRTIEREVAPELFMRPQNNVGVDQHDALADAEHQAQSLIDVFRRLRALTINGLPAMLDQ